MAGERAIETMHLLERSPARGRRPAHEGAGTDVSCPARRQGRAARRHRARRAAMRPPAPSVPVLIPPAGAQGDGGPWRWWSRIPFGLIVTILLGLLVLYAALSQGEDPFGSHHHVSYRFL